MESTPWNGPPPRTERELLALEEKTAKSALVNTVKAAARNLFSLADPRPWTQEHPWKSTGFAAVAGFVVATQVTSRSDTGQIPADQSPPSPEEATSGGPSPWDLVRSLLLSTGTDAMKTALTPWLAQKVSQMLPGNKTDTQSEPEIPPQTQP